MVYCVRPRSFERSQSEMAMFMDPYFSLPRRYVVFGFSVLALAAALTSASEQPAPKPTDVPATVIAHLSLPQATGSQMLLQTRKRQTLPLRAAGREARVHGGGCFQSGEAHPPETNRRIEPVDLGKSGDGEPRCGHRGGSGKNSFNSEQQQPPTETVRVLDLSDPRNPKTLETFNKVTSILPDGGHSLIFLTNNDGLWILRYNHPSLLEPARRSRPATPNPKSWQCRQTATESSQNRGVKSTFIGLE